MSSISSERFAPLPSTPPIPGVTPEVPMIDEVTGLERMVEVVGTSAGTVVPLGFVEDKDGVELDGSGTSSREPFPFPFPFV